jgi:hypothetical protein
MTRAHHLKQQQQQQQAQVVMEMEMQRPWLPTHLLDNHQQQAPQHQSQEQQQGELRVWMSMPRSDHPFPLCMASVSLIFEGLGQLVRECVCVLSDCLCAAKVWRSG